MRYLIYGNSGLMGCPFTTNPGQVMVSVSFEEPLDGTLLLGKAAYPVRGGKASVPVQVYEQAKTATFTATDGKTITLEVPNGDLRDLVQAVSESVAKAEARLADLKKRVEELEQYMLPKDNGLF